MRVCGPANCSNMVATQTRVRRLMHAKRQLLVQDNRTLPLAVQTDDGTVFRSKV